MQKVLEISFHFDDLWKCRDGQTYKEKECLLFILLTLFFSYLHSETSKLIMAANELNHRFGNSDVAVKHFTRFLSAFGHPRPFTTVQEAEVALRMADVVSALTLNKSDHWLLVKTKTVLMARSGLALRQIVYNIFSAVWKRDVAKSNQGRLLSDSFVFLC